MVASYQNWARIVEILNMKQETNIFNKTSMSMSLALSCMARWWTCRRGRWSSMASPCWRRLSPPSCSSSPWIRAYWTMWLHFSSVHVPPLILSSISDREVRDHVAGQELHPCHHLEGAQGQGAARSQGQVWRQGQQVKCHWIYLCKEDLSNRLCFNWKYKYNGF